MEFIAVSPISKKIYKLASMLRDMDVNVYIYGEEGVGKSFLAKFISPNAILYNDKLKDTNQEVIIENITHIPDNFKRIIATGNSPLFGDLKDKFTMQIELKPLNERKEDISAFYQLFEAQAKQELKIQKEIIPLKNPKNLHIIKQDIYKQLLCNDYDKNDIIDVLKQFFRNHYTQDDSYNSMLKLFDKALIEVLLDKYKSKLQVAKHLKINRHTLTKKVNELED
jgi:DNA-binding NtrC family response regulator